MTTSDNTKNTENEQLTFDDFSRDGTDEIGSNSDQESDDNEVLANDSDTATDQDTNRLDRSIDPNPSYFSKATEGFLNSRQLLLYRQEREEFKTWMQERGKNPDNRDGLAESTVENNLRRIDKISRWIWENANQVLLQIPQEWADEFCAAMDDDDICKDNGEPYSISHKRKNNDALRKYFEWQACERGGDKWTPPIQYNDKSHKPADEFTKEERRKLRESVLTYDSIPSYSDCDPEQRSRLKAYLAQRLGKPKEEISPEDWEQIKTSWERASLIWVALDAGLRPIEVKRATLDWLRLEKQSLYIPKEESSKNRENWKVSLLPQTVEILRRWKVERKHLKRYDETDKLWLTREGNPWGSDSLNYLLERVCEEAEIEGRNRRIVWYSIRHSVGEHMTSEGGIEQAKEQLRHKSHSTTLKYTHPSLENRQDTLQNMG